MVKDEQLEASDCAERVRAVKRTLFGSTLGNKYRDQVRQLREQEPDGLKRLARNTRAALLDRAIENPTLAELALAQMARQKEHAAVIFFALELANLSLTSPQMQEASVHQQWVADVSRYYDKPFAMVFQCLEWLAN